MKLFRDPVAPKSQLSFLPASVDDYVPEDAPARVLSEIIDGLDCCCLYEPYRGGGAPAYEPKMLLKVLVFGYSQGLRASRKLAEALTYDLRFMFLAEMSRPDFRTLCRFRRSQQQAIGKLFCQSVALAQQMGLVLLEHTAVDGTKLEANAARRNIVNASQIEKRLAAVDERIAKILQEAEEEDAKQEKEEADAPRDEIPKELKSAKARKKRLEQAQQMLCKKQSKNIVTTDPDSRLMKTRAGWRAAYNGQAAVDSAHQIIVAAEVVEEEADNAQLPAVVEQVIDNCKATPQTITADTGYWSVGTLEYIKERALNAYIPDNGCLSKTGYTYEPERDVVRLQTGEELYFNRERLHQGKRYRIYRKCQGGRKEIWLRVNDHNAQAMRARLTTKQGKAIYRLRQEIVEPVFGQIKTALGLRRLLLRGLAGAKIEFLLACSAHNLRKMMPGWSKASCALGV